MGCLALLVGTCLFCAVLFGMLGRPGQWRSSVTGAIIDRTLAGPIGTWWGPLVRAAAVQGSYAYVGLGTRLGILDMRDPTQPKLTDIRFSGGIAHGFCQTEDTLYMAAGTAGLTAFDIRDPAHPKIVGRYRTFGYSLNCTVKDGRLLLSDEMAGWQYLDVRDPSNIRSLATLDGGWVEAATIDGNIAYILDGRRGLDVFDLSNPERPTKIGNLALHLPPGAFHADPPPLWMEVREGYAYIANNSDGLRVVDVTDPRNPKLVSHLPLDGYSYMTAVKGDRAYVANLSLGLVIVDISRPEAPRPIRVCRTPGNAYDVILRGDLGYVSDGANGFLIMDVKDMDNPRGVGYVLAPPAARSITLDGDTLIVSCESAGIDFYDVSGDGTPRFASHLDTKGLAVHTAVRNGKAIAADVLGGALVVDIRDRTRPRIETTFMPEDHPWEIAVDGDFGYVANGHHGFTILDLRDEFPKSISNDYPRLAKGAFGYLMRVRKLGSTVLVSDIAHGVFVYDVSDPFQPSRLTTYPPPPSLIGQFLRNGKFSTPVIGTDGAGSVAYLAAYDRGLEIVDLADPANPRRLGRMPTSGYAYGVSYRSGRVAVCEYGGRVHLVDVSDPSRPRRLRTWKIRGDLQDVVLAERKIYVAAGPEGLAAINIEQGTVDYFPIVLPDQPMLECRDADKPPPADEPPIIKAVNVLPVALGGGPADPSLGPCPPCNGPGGAKRPS